MLEMFQVNSNFSMTAIDDFVNRDMVAEMLNILGVQIPNSAPNISDHHHINTFDPRLFSSQLSEEEEDKQRRFHSGEIGLSNILDLLTGCDVRTLLRAEEELGEAGHWDRLSPSQVPAPASPSYQDVLLAAWELRYSADREEGRGVLTELCSQKLHLEVPEQQ